ncbi:hypothetical protein [Fretibacterium fastidiosum]|uniref:hypothetical protein n=1 Tax=Fretibacterium fastidiosum TaxID=651822 RepID=UPI001FB09A04|nr:hypothetical protein [Fretibacterium fastidiosum]
MPFWKNSRKGCAREARRVSACPLNDDVIQINFNRYPAIAGFSFMSNDAQRFQPVGRPDRDIKAMYVFEMLFIILLVLMALYQARILQNLTQRQQPRRPRVHILIGQPLP